MGIEPDRLHAVILCAGLGARLAPFTDRLPKCLVDLDRRSVLDRALAAVRSVGVRDVSVVAGHAHRALEHRWESLERHHGVQLRMVFNAYYSRYNNAYSLWLGLQGLVSTTVVLNGDTVVSSEALRRIVGAPRFPLTLAIDTAKALGEEEMKVQLEGNRLVGLSKHLTPESAKGEFVGLSRVDGEALASVRQVLCQAWKRNPDLYYEDAFYDLANSGLEVSSVEVGDLPWIEIDTPTDLRKARGMRWSS